MKLTSRQLKSIIKEEVSQVLGGAMNDKEFNQEVSHWSGTEINFVEDDVVWAATQDDGAIIQYLEGVLKRARRDRAVYRAERERNM